MSLFREKVRRAAYRHRCCQCEQWIAQGEPYLSRVELYGRNQWGRSAMMWKMHLGCAAAHDAACKTVLEEMFAPKTISPLDAAL